MPCQVGLPQQDFASLRRSYVPSQGVRRAFQCHERRWSWCAVAFHQHTPHASLMLLLQAFLVMETIAEVTTNCAVQLYVHHYGSPVILGSGAELRGSFSRQPLRAPYARVANGTQMQGLFSRMTNIQLINTGASFVPVSAAAQALISQLRICIVGELVWAANCKRSSSHAWFSMVLADGS